MTGPKDSRPSNEPRRVETETAVIWIDERGLVRQDMRPGSHETLDTAQRGFEVMLELNGSDRFRVLVDLRHVGKIDREARQFYGSSRVAERIERVALIVKSGLSRALGQFFLGLRPPFSEIRLFTSVEDAARWLAEGQEKTTP